MAREVTEIRVSGDPGYPVVVGRGLLDELPEHLGSRVAKVLIVHPPTLGARAEALRARLAERYQVFLAEVPDAEAAKRVEVAAFCWQILGQTDFTRSDAVIGLGGGATTDLAGFVAATWLRGVDVVHIPTTVLGMVDAAVGGKTGINTAEGKNLVGAFHAPRAVLCDLELLDPLPRNEILAGFAEIVKAGFIAEPEILEILEADVDAATDPRTPQFRRVVELAIGVKARVVGEDFTEQGLREILNYGHTLGHAIEHAERYQWRHGAAISIGMVFAAELSRLTRALDDDTVARHRRILESLSLPTTYPPGRWSSLLATMQRDKKARGGMLRFIVLDAVGRPTTISAPDEGLLFAAYQNIAELPRRMRVLVLNGPNLGRLGSREPDVYGAQDLAALRKQLEAAAPEGTAIDVRQTDDEGELIHWLHEAVDERAAVILNPAAFTHYSYAVRDAAALVTKAGLTLIEVHITNPHARETFRHTSVVSAIATGVIAGFGFDSYLLALSAVGRIGAR